ncbi:MAG TPA: 1-phosphofructokinase [Chloroflexi bacterium]|nr:1-phosphofructokinase [Chloroflexota bacterium]HPO59226.1 1-phosphofructokinase [Anaerolineaceae bacterium]
MIYTVTLNPAVDREYTVPEILLDEVLRADSCRVDFGGKGFNVSRQLRAVGVDSVALGLVGGRAGQMLEEGLRSLGIRSEFVWIQGETRTNTSIVTHRLDHHIKVNEPGAPMTDADAKRLMETIERSLAPGDWWVLSGSLPPGAPEDIYARIIERVQAAGAYALLDTSGRALARGLEARPDLVKPNAFEAGQVTGHPVSTREELLQAVRALHERGAARVVVSLGRDGALASDGQSAWIGEPPSVQEHNPVGAGDAMVGGLVWRLSLGESLAQALPWGLACGAAAASLPGTAMGDLDQVQAFIPFIKLAEVKHAI